MIQSWQEYLAVLSAIWSIMFLIALTAEKKYFKTKKITHYLKQYFLKQRKNIQCAFYLFA